MATSGKQIAAVRTTRKGATIHKTNERPGTRAQVRYVRVSASKAREVLDLIRGLHIAEADEILEFVERDVAIIIRKALASAVANATNNDAQDPEALFISACYADEGPTLKRWRPRARGRATRIRKRTCHITIIVTRLPEAELRLRNERQAASGRAAGGATARASRRERVAKSRAATHDHDHDHDHEEAETDTPDVDETAEEKGSGEIKGNRDSMKYHVPGSQWYDQTEAEEWFETIEDAEAAGFEPAGGEAKQVEETDDESAETDEKDED